jgi:DNA-binding transcriptional LysR family regulator
MQHQAALRGVGVALLPLRAVWFGLRDGTLVHVAKEWSATELSIYLVFVGRRGMLPSVRALIDTSTGQRTDLHQDAVSNFRRHYYEILGGSACAICRLPL